MSVHQMSANSIIGDSNHGGSGIGGLQNCWLGTTVTNYVSPPIQLRLIANGVIVQVGYIYNGPVQGEYAFKDATEASEFIKGLIEKMITPR